MFFQPLEQFQIIPILTGYNCIFFTNETVFLFLFFFYVFIFFKALISSSNSSFLLVIPNHYQAIVELLHKLILSLISENIKSKNGELFFPIIITLFIFVLMLNLIGLIPYSFTVTSHIIVTLTLSISSFIGLNIIAVKKYGITFFSLFLPAGTNLALAFLLVPIELISFLFKPISLAIRLFANLMAGHALLKVIAGFATTLMISGGFFIILSYVPFFILVPLYGLEFGIALIQSFVFAVLICIYINDSVNISH